VWIGDDAALVRIGGAVVAASADALVDGVHADLRLTSLGDLGWKALAVNVSDLAAMGCLATRALVTVSAPAADVVGPLYEGLLAAAEAFGCAIVGGDLTAAERLVVSVSVLGDGGVDPPPVLRSGAHAGDEIWVTGPLGAAAAGLRALLAGEREGSLVVAHARPTPRVAEGVAARELGATAMIDVSDGLAGDLGHVLDASGVGCALDDVPVAAGATASEALAGGDDYELVWCCPPGAGVVEAFDRRGLRPPIRLGRCLAEAGIRTLRGAPLGGGGWDHFGRAAPDAH
jgi:thiamine-monophosphate kinase